MDRRIRELLSEIAKLEEELLTELHQRKATVNFTIRGKRVEFETEVLALHRQLRRSVLRWLTRDRPQNLLTGPVIYGLAIPLAVLDFSVTVFQLTCFPVYGIAKVRRGDYIVFDRHRLAYLNFIERFHCEFCAYANGLLAYASEIAGRTEQYFCPIKHARKILGTHARYASFLDYGESERYHARLEEFRLASSGSQRATDS